MEVIVNNDSNDLYWKELADYLRNLNVDFYWKMVHEKPLSRPLPPPRPCVGGRIAMTMKQEHTPPVHAGDEDPVTSKKSEIKDRKRTTPERWLR